MDRALKKIFLSVLKMRSDEGATPFMNTMFAQLLLQNLLEGNNRVAEQVSNLGVILLKTLLEAV